jgi:hypothetical protein
MKNLKDVSDTTPPTLQDKSAFEDPRNNPNEMHTKDKSDPFCEHNDQAHGNGAIGRP